MDTGGGVSNQMERGGCGQRKRVEGIRRKTESIADTMIKVGCLASRTNGFEDDAGSRKAGMGRG